MRVPLVINGIDFNYRLDEAREKILRSIIIKYELDKWLYDPEYPRFSIFEELLPRVYKSKSDWTQAMAMTFAMQKQELEKKKAMEKHDLFVRYGWMDYANGLLVKSQKDDTMKIIKWDLI